MNTKMFYFISVMLSLVGFKAFSHRLDENIIDTQVLKNKSSGGILEDKSQSGSKILLKIGPLVGIMKPKVINKSDVLATTNAVVPAAKTNKN